MLLFCAAAMPAVAQEKGNLAFGLRNSLYTHTGSGAHYGIGLCCRYNFLDGLRIEPAVMFVAGRRCSVDMSVEAHYTLPVRDNMYVYPIVGVGVNEIGHWSASLDVGAGYDWEMTHHWILAATLRYMVQTANHRTSGIRNPIVPSVGVGYRF